jgi:hypothetical protein
LDYWARQTAKAGDRSILTYLNRYAIGKMCQSSFLKDMATDDWQEDDKIGPVQPVCLAHKASDAYRIS